jgi:CheY-like chemotaxis protein
MPHNAQEAPYPHPAGLVAVEQFTMSAITVLAVDDDADTIDLIDETLAGHGFKVLQARSGTDAMSILLSHSVDLVLLDVMMPDMNGFAVLEMVRFIPRLMDTPVLVHTAHGDQYNLERIKGLGVTGVLHKPVSPSVLLEQVRACLAHC